MGIIIDILTITVVLAIALIGGPIAVRKLLSMDPKRKELEQAHELDELGETNTVRHRLTEARKCFVCKKTTDPTTDLRMTSSWVHLDCYEKMDKEN